MSPPRVQATAQPPPLRADIASRSPRCIAYDPAAYHCSGSRGEIRVDLDSHRPSGAKRYWHAMVRGDQLGLCEIHNGRHCMRFARPGHRVEELPR